MSNEKTYSYSPAHERMPAWLKGFRGIELQTIHVPESVLKANPTTGVLKLDPKKVKVTYTKGLSTQESILDELLDNVPFKMAIV